MKLRAQKRLRAVAATLAAAAGLLVLSVAAAQASTPWWSVETGARPTYLSSPVSETQELKAAPVGTATLLELDGKRVACMGTLLCGALGLSNSETAAELQSALEAAKAYGAGGVEVTETPAGSRDFTIDSIGPMAKRWVTPLEVTGGTAKILAEGGSGRLVFTATDVGDAPVDGAGAPVTLTDRLPSGVTAYHAEAYAGYGNLSGPVTCTLPSETEVSCVYEQELPLFEAIEVEVFADIEPGTVGTPGEVSISGGGAPARSASQSVIAREGKIPFGAASFAMQVEEEGGAPAIQAGGHPFQLTQTLQFNVGPMRPGPRVDSSVEQEGQPRNVRVKLPPGLVGNPRSLPTCSFRQFTIQHELVDECPPETAIGVASVTVIEGELLHFARIAVPIFNIEPGYGEPARFGFMAAGVPVTIDTALLGEEAYAVRAEVNDTSQLAQVLAASVTLWGNPGARSHDTSRGWACVYFSHPGVCSRPGSLTEAAFLRQPVSCESPLVFGLEVEPWNLPLGSDISEASDVKEALLGCSRVPFDPSAAAAPTSKLAANPSGLDFELDLPNAGLESTNEGAVSETEPEKVEVDLPEGMTVNPSEAEGLAGCSEAAFGREATNSLPGEGCPEASKIGSVEASTPLLNERASGALYIATPYENPFGSLVALYLVARIPDRGVLIKQAGKVELDPVTGQLRTVFEGLPQLPYSEFKLHFREGGRAPLVTPSTCGTYQTVAKLVPYSAASVQDPAPSEVVQRTSAFTIEHGVEGGACPAGGVPPFQPGFTAGTANNAAGAYSPLNLRITRKDGEQEITGFATQLPAGLTANLTGVPFCSEADISLARTKSGAEEEAEPSCPAASQIGRTLVGVGVGSVLAYTPGKLYMAGPFEGAPFSVVAITAAKVGPFDLGTVIVHLPLEIDPVTARVSIPQGAADQIPHIIDGIVVHVRDIQVEIEREDFTLNPTSCEKMSLAATVYGSGANFASAADDDPVAADSPFQAADCQALAFKPTFKASTSAKTSRKRGASLHVKLTYPAGALGHDANVHVVKVELPKALPSRLSTLQQACTAAQFEANPAGCPAASIVGHAKAVTPILPVPLEGPAYFVSYGGLKFPELVVVLQGYGITIDLHGETYISKKGITSSTFHQVPDQPVSSFELTLPEGKDSALAAPGGKLCKQKLVMPTSFTAQNGASVKQNTAITVTGCKATSKKKAKHRKEKRKAGKEKRKAGKEK
ncbi:MAG TPA: hypothetical protein VGF95_13780 [Solirubrobacteraceae bacterium]|jgi:hypothetical protein